MPLHIPGASDASYPEFTDLADRVTNGDGTGWAGDQRLWLGIGVAKHQGKTGHRLEVWRYCEDGTDQLIGTWHPSEQYRVCYDLAQMRLDAPGRQATIDRIDAHNDRLEQENMEPWREYMAEKVERLAYQLMRKQGNARNRFAVSENPLAR